MEQNEKKKNIGMMTLLVLACIVALLLVVFIIYKSLFSYRPFLTHNKEDVVMTKLVWPNELKVNDTIVHQTGKYFYEDKILKIAHRNGRNYYTVNNYDNTKTIVLNQDQIISKRVHVFKGLGYWVVYAPFYICIIGIILIVFAILYIRHIRNTK